MIEGIKNLISILVFVTLLFSGISLAYSPQVDARLADNFHGKKWGEHIDNIEGLEFVQRSGDHFDVYADPEEEPEYLGIPVEKIHYVFEYDRFVYVAILFEGKDTFDRLARDMVGLFGPAEFFEDEREVNLEESYFYWQGKQAAIEVRFDNTRDLGRIIIMKGVAEPEDVSR